MEKIKIKSKKNIAKLKQIKELTSGYTKKETIEIISVKKSTIPFPKPEALIIDGVSIRN